MNSLFTVYRSGHCCRILPPHPGRHQLPAEPLDPITHPGGRHFIRRGHGSPYRLRHNSAGANATDFRIKTVSLVDLDGRVFRCLPGCGHRGSGTSAWRCFHDCTHRVWPDDSLGCAGSLRFDRLCSSPGECLAGLWNIAAGGRCCPDQNPLKRNPPARNGRGDFFFNIHSQTPKPLLFFVLLCAFVVTRVCFF